MSTELKGFYALDAVIKPRPARVVDWEALQQKLNQTISKRINEPKTATVIIFSHPSFERDITVTDITVTEED